MELHMYRCTELNANKLKQKTNLIYIEFGTCEVRCLKGTSGAIHTSELDRSEIDLSPKRSECERSNAN